MGRFTCTVPGMTDDKRVWIAAWYAALSLLTMAVYGWDKLCAMRNWRRVPEARLHLLALLGGWPGAAVAQQLFRHKSEKQSFRVVYALTVVLHLAAVVGLLWWRYSA